MRHLPKHARASSKPQPPPIKVGKPLAIAAAKPSQGAVKRTTQYRGVASSSSHNQPAVGGAVSQSQRRASSIPEDFPALADNSVPHLDRLLSRNPFVVPDALKQVEAEDAAAKARRAEAKAKKMASTPKPAP